MHSQKGLHFQALNLRFEAKDWPGAAPDPVAMRRVEDGSSSADHSFWEWLGDFGEPCASDLGSWYRLADLFGRLVL